jgi:feruloyl esterase
LRKLYSGPSNSQGQQVYPGLAPGGELLWQPVVGGPGAFGIGEAVYRDMVKQDPAWDWRTLNYDADLAQARSIFGESLDALNPDLSVFKDGGGKLIIYHGVSDPLVQAERTRQYFAQIAGTSDFARLYLQPGVGHCRSGEGADAFDGLGPLIQWVEANRPPTRIVAGHYTDGQLVFTRPMCSYPTQARFSGAGDPRDESSFLCR